MVLGRGCLEGLYALGALKRETAAVWNAADRFLLPTAPTTYTLAQMQADPIRLNSRLGLYINFTDLLIGPRSDPDDPPHQR